MTFYFFFILLHCSDCFKILADCRRIHLTLPDAMKFDRFRRVGSVNWALNRAIRRWQMSDEQNFRLSSSRRRHRDLTASTRISRIAVLSVPGRTIVVLSETLRRSFTTPFVRLLPYLTTEYCRPVVVLLTRETLRHPGMNYMRQFVVRSKQGK